MGRSRSVSEVGTRPGAESLYKLNNDEIWNVVESNWTEVVLTPPLSALQINNTVQWGKQKPEMIYILCRKGVPKHRIGDIWYNLSKLIPNTKYIMVSLPLTSPSITINIITKCTKERTTSPSHYCLYHQLCEISSPFEQQILADIHRTFPDQEVSATPDFQKVNRHHFLQLHINLLTLNSSRCLTS